MNDVLYINGRFTTTDERVIGVEDRGFQFGDAVYEVFKFLGKRPIVLSEHYRRMEQGLREIEIHVPWDVTELGVLILDSLARTQVDDGHVAVDERPLRELELFDLDEAFITSTTLGVMPVASIDGRTMRRGEITPKLQRLFDDDEARALV